MSFLQKKKCYRQLKSFTLCKFEEPYLQLTNKYTSYFPLQSSLCTSKLLVPLLA